MVVGSDTRCDLIQGELYQGRCLRVVLHHELQDHHH